MLVGYSRVFGRPSAVKNGKRSPVPPGTKNEKGLFLKRKTDAVPLGRRACGGLMGKEGFFLQKYSFLYGDQDGKGKA